MISKEKIKHIRSLQRKKHRDIHQQFVIEGAKMIKEAIDHAPESIIEIYGTSPLPFKLPNSIPFHEINSKELSQLSSLKTPQPQIALCTYLPRPTHRPNFLIALDTIQDPGNFGTILRLASWFGVNYIMASRDTVDLYNPKVIQASMGAIFTVNVVYVDLSEELKNTDLPIYGAVLEGENVYKKELKREGIILMGNEGNGIHQDILPFVSSPITIPKFGHGESLNVAMATAIILSEFTRSEGEIE